MRAWHLDAFVRGADRPGQRVVFVVVCSAHRLEREGDSQEDILGLSGTVGRRRGSVAYLRCWSGRGKTDRILPKALRSRRRAWTTGRQSWTDRETGADKIRRCYRWRGRLEGQEGRGGEGERERPERCGSSLRVCMNCVISASLPPLSLASSTWLIAATQACASSAADA